MPKHDRIATLPITEFSKDGLGRGIWLDENGKEQPVEVPFSVPGDEVAVRLLKRRGGVYKSILLEELHLSHQRVKPLCKHFASCGGCRWQHISYADQLKQKEALIRCYLDPYLQQETVWHSIIPCLPPWQYRNKMELTFSSNKAGEHFLGLILYGTRGHVFQMEECHLAHSWIAESVEVVSKWRRDFNLDAYHPGSNKGALRTLTFREGFRTGDRMVMLTVSGNPDYSLNKAALESFVDVMRKTIEPTAPDQKLSIFLRIQQIAKGKPTQFFEMLLHGPDHIREVMKIETKLDQPHSLNFRISPSAFFQPNTLQAEKLYSRAIQLTELAPNSIVYDLYCGTGTLGICMAKEAKAVIGIELNPESALDARENVKHNHLSNVTIHTGDVGRLLPELLKQKELRPDVVIVDPPRAGLDAKALQTLVEMKAPRLTYISCNPATQAANLEVLIQGGGYHLKAVQPVDQFPQTVHVENICILSLS